MYVRTDGRVDCGNREDEQWRINADRSHGRCRDGNWSVTGTGGNQADATGVPAEDRFEVFRGQRWCRRFRHFRREYRRAPRAGCQRQR